MLRIILAVVLLVLMGCNADQRQTLQEVHAMSLKNMKEGHFVGHYSLSTGGSEAGMKNGVYLDSGLRLQIDGDYDFRGEEK